MRLSWKIYAITYSLLVLANTAFSLSPESRVNDYYQILIILDKTHWLNLALFYFATAMELISLVPLFLFVFRKYWLSPNLWKILFILRLAGLLSGRNYEYNTIRSLLAANTGITIAALAVSILIYLPSYFAQFNYAFTKK